MSKKEVPEEVIKLNRLIQQLAAFKTVVAEGSFRGKDAQIVDDLRKHLHETYQQVYEQFHSHPVVKSQLEAQEKQLKEDEKLAAEIEKNLEMKTEIN